jgi:hypothetical protein
MDDHIKRRLVVEFSSKRPNVIAIRQVSDD